MREIDRLSEPTAYSNADFIAPQALVISDGKPFKSPAVNTVASTFWYYVASTIFMALCVTQDVLKLPQLRKVSTILVVGHVFVFLLAIFRHAEEARSASFAGRSSGKRRGKCRQDRVRATPSCSRVRKGGRGLRIGGEDGEFKADEFKACTVTFTMITG